MLGVFSTNLFMCRKYARHERYSLSVCLLMTYGILKIEAKLKTMCLGLKIPFFDAQGPSI